MFGMEMIIAGSVTPLSTPQGRWGALAGVTTTRAAKSRMSVGTARRSARGGRTKCPTPLLRQTSPRVYYRGKMLHPIEEAFVSGGVRHAIIAATRNWAL